MLVQKKSRNLLIAPPIDVRLHTDTECGYIYIYIYMCVCVCVCVFMDLDISTEECV